MYINSVLLGTLHASTGKSIPTRTTRRAAVLGKIRCLETQHTILEFARYRLTNSTHDSATITFMGTGTISTGDM
jgi:hypothetical protein